MARRRAAFFSERVKRMIKTTLTIDGMMCPMCESHVNDAIRAAARVKKVTSSHRKGTAEILSEEALPEEQLRAALEKTGYRVLSVTAETVRKKGFFGF